MTIEFKRNFRKRYRKIPFKIRRQFDERLSLFMKESYHPVLNNHPLTGDRTGQWSINVTGDWRAVFREFESGKLVHFDFIGTHSQLYK